MSKKQRLRRAQNVGATKPVKQADLAWDGEDSHSHDSSDDTESSAAGPAGLAGYDWHGEFVELEARFPWRVAAYIAWASSPRKLRRPAKQSDLASLLGLKTDRTIRKWIEDDPAILGEIKRLQASPIVTHRRDIYEALVQGALDIERGHQDRKLALELLGDYRAKAPDALPPGEFTADEAAQAERELRAFQQQQAGSGGDGEKEASAEA